MKNVLTADETRKRILDLLEENNISKKDLNDKLGTSGLNLYKYLSGRTASIHADVLAAIALGLGVSCDDLLTNSTGEKLPASAVASYLGLSESSVRWIRSLDKISKTGLDSAISKNKHTRTSFGALLLLIGTEILSPVVSDRDFLLFRACRIVCDLLNRL